MSNVLRGQIYLAKHPDLEDKKYFLVASNNQLNRALMTALCLRVTSTDKRDIPTCVKLPTTAKGPNGYVVCNDIYWFNSSELENQVTAIPDSVMKDIEKALKLVFSIRD